MSREAVLVLLSDIKAQPEDDALRLILADWLEDHGREADRARADLIRAQVRVDPIRGEDIALLRRLRETHAADWLAPLTPWVQKWGTRRGMLRVEIGVPSLRAGRPRALAGEESWAWVDHVELGPERANLTGHLRDCPLLARLNAFGASRMRGQGPDLAVELAASPWLASVRRLDLSHQGLAAFELDPLLASANLQTLTHLDLGDNAVGVATLRRLSEAPWATRLRCLTLHRSTLGDAEAAALAESEALASLHELDLRDNRIGERGAMALAESFPLRNLESLTLWGNPVGAGAEALRRRFGHRVHMTGG